MCSAQLLKKEEWEIVRNCSSTYTTFQVSCLVLQVHRFPGRMEGVLGQDLFPPSPAKLLDASHEVFCFSCRKSPSQTMSLLYRDMSFGGAGRLLWSLLRLKVGCWLESEAVCPCCIYKLVYMSTHPVGIFFSLYGGKTSCIGTISEEEILLQK